MLRMSLHKCMTRRLSHASLVNRLLRHSPCMSLRGFARACHERSVVAAITCLLLVLVACGDDDSDFATRPSDDSSSSVTPKSSSSSKVPEPAEKSSSSTKSSSSSEYIRVPCDVETDENCFEDARDGQTYKTVKIGDQVWMAENLNYKTDSSFCYNDSVEYCEKYGRLYTWAVAMDSAGTWSANGMGCGYNKTCSPAYPVRGVCPSGWHLPDTTEWNTLFNAVGGSSIAGTKLKFMSGWYNSGNGTDDFGFSAPPAGYRHYYGYYNYEGRGAYFWSSTEFNSNGAYYMGLYYSYDPADLNIDGKNYGFSVRCLKDYDDESSSSVKNESSSSVTLSSSSSDISVVEESSSSEDSSNSSSSDSEKSSSSAGEAASSSSSVELNCSALLEGTDGWSWDIPKECRFNPDITYGTMADSRDGQTYKTVKIGEQTWMAENLNYADSTKTPSLLKRSWCYNNNVENCAVAGRLYTWSAAIDSVKLATDADNPQDCGYGKICTLPAKVQGICPEGWHLPTRAEWNTLFAEVGGGLTAGKVLKSQTGWYNKGSGTDGVGFFALSVGYRDINGIFRDDGIYANFWSTVEFKDNFAYRMCFYYDDESAGLYNFNKINGVSVRCLQDDP